MAAAHCKNPAKEAALFMLVRQQGVADSLMGTGQAKPNKAQAKVLFEYLLAGTKYQTIPYLLKPALLAAYTKAYSEAKPRQAAKAAPKAAPKAEAKPRTRKAAAKPQAPDTKQALLAAIAALTAVAEAL